LMPDWKATTLGDFISLQRGHDLPKQERRPGEIPVIGSGGLTGFHETAVVSGPGITIGRAANLGTPTLIQEDFWPLNTTLYVTDFHGNDIRFAYYLLQTLDLTGFDSGSVQPMLNRNYIRNFPLRVPGAFEQRAVADVLGALDDKIVANKKTADTSLELAMAEYEASVASGKFTRSISLADCGHWLSGGTPSTSDESYWGGDIPWISAASLKVPWIEKSDRNITDLGAQNGTRTVPRDTIIFVVRGMSLNTEFRIGLTQREVAFGQDCKALRPAVGIDAAVLFVAIKSRSSDILGLVDQAGHGTGRLATDRLFSVMISLPEDAFNAEAAAMLRPLVAVGAARHAESRNLRELRDALLPKLMSGEIRVRDAEKVVEDVT
jgi:type I restriction enzyme S subunit